MLLGIAGRCLRSSCSARTGTHATYLCGHGGARTVDHVIPLSERPELVFSLVNTRPSHGTKNACTVCGLKCNNIKSVGTVERAKKIIAERIAENEKNRKSPLTRNAPRLPETGGEGREW